MKTVRTSKILLHAVVLVAIALAGAAHAAPPAPQFMPGFPMLAGPLVMIMWTPVPGAVKYHIYMNGEKVGEAVMPPFQGSTPEAAGQYRFEIKGVDASGAEGPAGNPGVISVIALEPPKELDSRLMGDRVALKWPHAVGASIFNVYRKGPGDADFTLVTSVQAAKYQDATVEPGKTYAYVVTSKDVSGKESARSPEAVVEVPAANMNESGGGGAKYDLVLVRTKLVGYSTSTLDYELREVTDIVNIDGDLYFVDEGRGDVKVLPAGDPERGTVFIAKGRERGQLIGPKNLGVTPTGDLVVTTGLQKGIHVFDTGGKEILSFKLPEAIPEDWPADLKKELKKTTPIAQDVACTSDGRFWVADAGWHRVVEFDATGQYVASHGKRGSDAGDFFDPKLVLVTPDDQIVVGEGLGRRFQAFSSDMSEVVGSFGSAVDWVGAFLGVTGITLGHDGQSVLIADGSMNTVQAFSLKDYKYLYHLGGQDGKLDEKMKGQRPWWTENGFTTGMAFDKGGNLWVANPQQQRLAVFKLLDR